MKKPLILIIMDGFGINPDTYGNAVKAARTPNLTRLFEENPCTAIGASGMDVGLPTGRWATVRWATPISARPGGVSGTDPDHQIHRGRRLF